jgi:hypothetical protein
MLGSCAVLLGVLASSARGAEPDSDTVLRWARAEWERAAGVFETPGIAYHYSVRMYAELSPDAVGRLAREVERRPDNPQRTLLDESRRRMSSGPDVAHYVAWCNGPDAMRVNRDFEGVEGFLDQVIKPGVMWTLTGQQLTIVDPRSAPENRDPRGSAATWEKDIGFFRFGGAHLGRSAGLVPLLAERRADGWHVVGKAPNGLEIDFSVAWDDQAAGATIKGGRYVSTPALPAAAGTSFAVSDWQNDPTLSLRLARQIDEFFPDGRPRMSRTLASVEKFDESTFASLAAVPGLEGNDPVRGKYTFSAVYDFRPAAPTRTVQTPGGWRVSELPSTAAPRWMREAGWTMLAALAAVLVSLRLRARVRPMGLGFRRKGAAR